MTSSPHAVAAAALALVGRPFRLHGRDPATGLDCVGLVFAVLGSVGARPVAPTGYGLRNLDIAHWLPLAARSGLTPAQGPVSAGDIILVSLAHCQHHLVIAADPGTIVHAHAGLRRVVRQPLDAGWRICARWQLEPLSEG